MASRGPDGDGCWLSDDGRVGFVHRRLAIIDLSPSGAQPMSSEDGKSWIVFNGEIYNYRKLRSDLETRGHRFKSSSDTEVILHLYAEHGAAMLPLLRGMFAFAIWDSRNRGLFLARDPFGIKPLYFSNDGETFRFASQVKSLVAGGGVRRREDPAGHVGFLLWGFVPDPFTMYKDVRALEAGSWMWVDLNGKATSTRYFCARTVVLETLGSPPEPHPEEALRHALEDSIDHHLVSDVPVGLFLSAGIDSCVVAAVAAKRLRNSLHALTLGFNEYRKTANDETILAERVAGQLGIAHSTRWMSRPDAASELDEFLAAMDQPSMDGLNTWLVSLAAKEARIKVALSGLGGDELFAGYPSFHQVPAMARFTSMIPGLGRIGKRVRPVLESVVNGFTSPKYAGLFEYGTTIPGAYLLRRALYAPWELDRLADPSFVKEGLEALCTETRLAESVRDVKNERLSVSLLEIDWYLKSQLLRDADWAGMAHSVEIRVPFVDVPLFRAVSQLAAHGAAPDKRELLHSVGGSLPAILADRPKTGFVVPVREWFGRGEPGEKEERGLRTWSRRVLSRWTDACDGADGEARGPAVHSPAGIGGGT
jgi:asparagine synthase (glutamine-hydrolysing)